MAGHNKLIDCSVPTQAPIEALIVFPKLDATLAPIPLGFIRGVALLQLNDGTVWMLEMPGRAWTAQRLKVASEILSAVSGQAANFARTAQQIGRALDVQALTLQTPNLDSVQPNDWSLQLIARALFERDRTKGPRKHSRGATAEKEIPTIESSLTHALNGSLRTFVSRLNPEAKGMASKDGHIDIALYNYLAYQPYQTYRQQFADYFPGLLNAVVSATTASWGEHLREIVDSGKPLVKSLAEKWTVRKGVVRHLIERPVDQLGTEWLLNMRELAILLNALRPEDLPGSDLPAWREFNRIVTLGGILFGQPIYELEAGLSWLRECVYRTNRGTAKTRNTWLPDSDAIGTIVVFRENLRSTLRNEIAPTDVATDMRLSEPVRDTVHWYLAGSAHKGLATISMNFELELDRLRERTTRYSLIAQGEAMLPLIPEDYVSKDGSRCIKTLTSRQQLKKHGLALANCLNGSLTYRFLRKGKNG